MSALITSGAVIAITITAIIMIRSFLFLGFEKLIINFLVSVLTYYLVEA